LLLQQTLVGLLSTCAPQLKGRGLCMSMRMTNGGISDSDGHWAVHRWR
jgi:hypothetical protein